MADVLKTFREGEDILASETNDNNQYLLSKLTDNAAQIQSYVEGEISTIKSNVASVQATLQNNIDAMNEIVSNMYHLMSPDFSKRASRSRDTNYTASQAGWVFFYSVSQNGNQVSYEINGNSYYLTSNMNRDTDTAGAGAWFMVGKGDKYKLNSAGSQGVWQAYYFPCKGIK